MDVADEAQIYEQLFLAEAIARFHASGAGGGTASALLCVDCDDEIPAARRAAIPGVRRCVHCQSSAERRASFVLKGE